MLNNGSEMLNRSHKQLLECAKDLYIPSLEEMILFGQEFGKTCGKDQVVALCGELGAGKTTIAKGIISGLCNVPLVNITSPTFQYVNFYGSGTIAHFDLWRLKGVDDFLSLGLEEWLAQGISLIEWPDRIESLLPLSTIVVESKVCRRGRRVCVFRFDE